MKSIVLSGIQDLSMREEPAPQIQNETDVLIKIGAVGVCGSDIHYYQTGRIGTQVVKFPFRIGHECAGTVAEIGSAVRSLQPGDKVAIDPAVSCYDCDQCKSGRPHTCRNLQFLGNPGELDGCLAEYLVMPEASCYPIPPEMPMDVAAFVEPLSIGVYAASLMDAARAEKVGILGAGPIGFSVMSGVFAEGVETIYMTDKIENRLDVANKAGAAWTGNPDEQDVVDEIHKREPLLLDAVFECCGEQEALDQALQMLKPGGELLIVGIPEPNRISFDINELRHREITIKNVRRQNDCVEPAISLIDSGKVNTDLFITHKYDFESVTAAYELVAGYEDGVVKAMIMLDN